MGGEWEGSGRGVGGEWEGSGRAVGGQWDGSGRGEQERGTRADMSNYKLHFRDV